MAITTDRGQSLLLCFVIISFIIHLLNDLISKVNVALTTDPGLALGLLIALEDKPDIEGHLTEISYYGSVATPSSGDVGSADIGLGNRSVQVNPGAVLISSLPLPDKVGSG